MNILIPDSWLREYLQTKATPAQIKEYLSLCGPSVERIRKINGEPAYDIEITTNRPDAMSVAGIAREAATILPRFGIAAKLLNDPYALDTKSFTLKHKKDGEKKLIIKTDSALNPRWTSVVLTHVKVGPSPKWLSDKLEATGIRSINNVIDVTNYLMRTYGQPAHAFDYDEIKGKDGTPTMTLRASRKGEKIITLDGKSHALPGGDIVIEDGAGRLIDLCGIMGAANSSVKNTTTSVVLFMQTYNPANIRKTSMALAHRTEAAGLFEKGLDSELVLPTVVKGVEMLRQLAGGRIASRLYDIYPKAYKSANVSVSKEKAFAYIGTKLTDRETEKILLPLGFLTHVTPKYITVTVPSWRRDVTIDVDIIEELARIYGYHNIESHLPDTEPPVVTPDPTLRWEQEIKTRLRDWGFTELYTYSMISGRLMDMFGLDKKKTYKIANPLSEEWVYMRRYLWPGILSSIEQNLHTRSDLKVFELSMRYIWRDNDLPVERPSLVIAWTGHKFQEAKGMAETLFSLFGLRYPQDIVKTQDSPKKLDWYGNVHLQLGEFGSVGEIKSQITDRMGISTAITILDLEIDKLVSHAKPTHVFHPIPKYPSIVEDISFVVPPGFQIGPLVESLKKAHPRVSAVTFLDAYQNKRTLRIHYSDPTKTLTNFDIAPIRQKLIEKAEEDFGVTVVTI